MHTMKVFYDDTDNNQVQAIYTEETNSTVWNSFSSIIVSDELIIHDLEKYGRDSRLTIVEGIVTVVTQFDHPIDHTLDTNKATKYKEMGNAVTKYIYNKSDDEAQKSIIGLHSRAAQNAMPNRQAHAAQWIDWVSSVFEEFYSKKTDIFAAVDQTALDAIALPDWSVEFDPTDPAVSIESTMAITD